MYTYEERMLLLAHLGYIPESIQDVQEAQVGYLRTAEDDRVTGPLDLSSEEWREYQQADGSVYRVWYPIALYRREEGGTTHRVVDVQGVVHCIPCGKLHPNVIIRWKTWDPTNPVSW